MSFLDVLVLAMSAGLVAGALDVSLAVVARPPMLSSFQEILAPLAATTLAAALGYMAVWILLLPLMLVLDVRRSDVAVGLAVLLVTTLSLIDFGHTAPFVRNPFRLALPFMVGLVVAFGVASWCRRANELGRNRSLASFGVAAVITILAATVFHWLFHYVAHASFSGRGLIIVVAGCVTCLILLVLFSQLRRAHTMRSIVAVIMALLMVAPVTFAFLSRAPDLTSTGVHRVRHVILIVIDTLRADMLSCYNTDAPPTPNLDDFAADAIRFDGALSPAPWTLPSMVSLMTALPASVHGANGNDSRSPEGVATLATRFKASGYVTAAVVDNPALGAPRGLNVGFDRYDHFPRTMRDNSYGTWILARLFPERYQETLGTDATTEMAGQFIADHADQSFFLWTHYYDPHGPYAPPAQFQPEGPPPARIGRSFDRNKDIRLGTLLTTEEEDAWIKKLYEGEVKYVDEAVGRLVGRLRATGIYDDALIVITSDHGEEFREHGGVAHGHTLYNEVLHVPLLIKLPKGYRAGETVEGWVSTQRVAPTILAECDLRSDKAPLGGMGATPLLPDTLDTERVVYASGVLYYGEREAFVFEDYKYIFDPATGGEQIYNLAEDPGETKSIANDPGPTWRTARENERLMARAHEVRDAHHEASERLQAQLDAGGARIQLDEETVRRLKALGYM